MPVQDCPATLSQPRLGGGPMLMDVPQERETESRHPLASISVGFPLEW